MNFIFQVFPESTTHVTPYMYIYIYRLATAWIRFDLRYKRSTNDRFCDINPSIAIGQDKQSRNFWVSCIKQNWILDDGILNVPRNKSQDSKKFIAFNLNKLQAHGPSYIKW